MPYLSRIFLNPNRRQARRLLGDPQAMHAAVLGGLPSQPVNERVLWRTDVHDPHRPGLLVLTRSQPSWEHITEQAGWPSADEPGDPQVLIRDYQPLLDRIAPGEEYAFRLTANPVQSTKRPEALTASQKERAVDGALQRSVRLGHRTVANQTAWLIARAQRSGFEVPPATSSGAVGEIVPALGVIGRARWSFNKHDTGARVVLQVVTYEGRLRVVDAEALRDAMLCGVGPAKAYGCGLLTLASLSKDQRR